MKVRIKRAFRDRDTKTLMHVGEEEQYEQGRAKELAGWGFVVLLEAVEEEPVPEAEPVETGSEVEPIEKVEFEPEAEKHEFTPFPEKSEGPRKRGRKPKE